MTKNGDLTIDLTATNGSGLDTNVLLYARNPDGSIGSTPISSVTPSGQSSVQLSETNLAAGDYMIAVGSYRVDNDEAQSTSAFPNSRNQGGDYELSLTGAAYLDGNGDTLGFPSNEGLIVDNGLSNDLHRQPR